MATPGKKGVLEGRIPRIKAAKAGVLPQSKARAVKPVKFSNRQLTYDEAVASYGPAVGTRERFTRLAQSDFGTQASQLADYITARAESRTQQSAASAASKAVQQDFEAVAQGRAGDVKNWKELAEFTVRLKESGDPEAVDTANALMWTHADELRQHVDVIDRDWWDKNLAEKPEEDLPWWGPVAKVAGAVGEYFDQWGQSSLSAQAGIKAALDKNDGISAKDALRHTGRALGHTFDVTRAIPDRLGGDLTHRFDPTFDPTIIDDHTRGVRVNLNQNPDQDRTLNLREVLGRDPNKGGNLAGVFDLIETIATDPSTYVGFGTPALAKIGMKGAEEAAAKLAIEGVDRTAVRAMNQRILREGFKKGLNAEEKVLYRRLVEAAGDIAREGGGRTESRLLRRDLIEQQMKSIERGGQTGLRLAGTTVAPTGKLGDIARGAGILDDVKYGRIAAEDGIERVSVIARNKGILSKMQADSKLGPLLNAVKPWARLRATQGSAVAEAVNALASSTKANADQLSEAVELRLGTKLDALNRRSVSTRSLQEFEGNEELWTKQLNEAMADPDRYTEVFEAAGPHTQNLLTSLAKVRDELRTDTLKIMGYTDEEVDDFLSGAVEMPPVLHDIDTYVARVVTGAAQHNEVIRTLRNISETTTGAVGGATPGRKDIDTLDAGFTAKRTLAPGVNNVQDVNRQLKAIMATHGIDVDKVFEDNQPALWAMHSKDVFAAKADIDLLDGLTELGTTEGGAPLALRVGSMADEAEGTALEEAHAALRAAGGDPAHYRSVPLPSGARYFVHEDIAKELENVRRIFGSPRETDAMRRFVDAGNNFWAAQATISGVNPGFHARNEIGNLSFMYYGGMRNPIKLRTAAQVQASLGKIKDHMRQTGATFDDAAAAVGTKEKHLRILKGAMENGVLSEGRSADMLRRTTKKAPRTKMTAGAYFDPRDSGSLINVTGARMGEQLEANSRLALYIDQLDKGATPATAAAHVKQFLFDYDDLTRFEKERIRLVSRFYTFTRKNMGLQLYMLAHYPARVDEAADAAAGLAALIPGLGSYDPALGGDEFGAPGYMANPLMRRVGQKNVAFQVDAPFGQALETGMLVPRLYAAFAQKQSPLDPVTPGERLGDSFSSLFSGMPVSAYNFMRETATRRDSFTGRPLDPENQGRDTALFRLAEVVLPSLSRIESQGAKAGQTRGGGDAVPGKLQLAQLLLGLDAVVVDADTDSTNRYLLRQKIEDVLTAARKDGREVPTIDELREKAVLDTKDRVTEALLYSWEPVLGPGGRVTGYQWSDDERRKLLLSIVPKDIRDLFGGELALPINPETGKERTGGSQGGRVTGLDYDAFDLAQAIRAIETWRGQPLTQEQRTQVVLASPWAPNNTQLEALGINPVREYEVDASANRFAPDAVKDKSYDDKAAEAQAKLDELAASAGLDRATMARLRPRMSEFARVLDEAQRAGVQGDELINYIVYAKDEGGGGVLSRADKAAINQLYGGSAMNGPVPITGTRKPKVTAEDLRKMQTKGWQAEQELVMFTRLYGLPAPSREQLERYVLNALMTKTEQKGLGIPTLKGAKNRVDVRSNAEKLNDASAKKAAGLRGINLGPGGAGSGEWFENRFTLDDE